MSTYEHYIYAPHELAARAIANEVQRRGAITGAPRLAASDDGKWLVMAYTDFDDRGAWGDAFRDIAQAHDGEYDGGGIYVGPPELLLAQPTQPESPRPSSTTVTESTRPWWRRLLGH